MNTITKLLSLLSKQERKKVSPLLLFMIVGMILETASVGLVVPLVTIMSNPKSMEEYTFLQPFFSNINSSSNNDGSIVIISMLLLVGIYIIKTLFLIYLYWKQTKFIYSSQEDISKRLFKKYLNSSYSFHITNNSAQLIRNVITETTQLANGAINTGMTLVIESFVLIGIIALLLYMEPIGALVVGISLGLVGFLFYFCTKGYIFTLGTQRQKDEGYRIQHMQQGLNGIKDIKILGKENYFLEKYSTHNKSFANVAQKQSFLLNIPRLGLELIAIISLVVLVLFMISNGKSMTEVVPVLAMFGAAAFRLMPSLNRILGNWQTFQYTIPVIDILYKEFNYSETRKIIRNKEKKKLRFKDTISIDTLSYAYDKVSQLALDSISLQIKKGTSVGFIGSSGAGKSTLLDILLGLLNPTDGHIFIDEYNLQENISSWQQDIGYVPQSIYLIDDTLKKNIAFGIEDKYIDEWKVKKAIELAQLTDYINNLEEGIDTKVGEMGVKLSGGQKQRIGIARALYNDPEVLVLDEATSALDNETEKDFMSAIDFLHGKKTLIIIAHRLTTVANCDYLYKLEKGKIVQSGTPKELIDV